MRRCRYQPCRREFIPAKSNHYFCCYEHCELHYAENDYRGSQRARNGSYDRGFWDGVRAKPADLAMPPSIWKGLLLFSHPDKWQGEPGLLTLANEVTRWLIEHRPDERN